MLQKQNKNLLEHFPTFLLNLTSAASSQFVIINKVNLIKKEN